MERLSEKASGLKSAQYATLRALDTPAKIQDYLDALPMNWEKQGETLLSPRKVFEEGKAHCLEGALLAATALWIQGEVPRVLVLSSREGSGDDDHVVALYERGGCYGAIGKTNHATIRFRDPVYRTLRELALSFFHEWFMNTTGEKTLESYSKPFDLSRLGAAWVSAEDLRDVDELLARLPYYPLITKRHWRHVRRADPMELAAGRLEEWPESDPHT